MTGRRRETGSAAVTGRPETTVPGRRFPASDVGSYELDASSTFVAVDDGFAAMTGHDADRLRGAHASIVYPDAAIDRLETIGRTLAESDGEHAAVSDGTDATQRWDPRARITLELPVATDDGDRRRCVHQLRTAGPDDGERFVATVQSTSEDDASGREPGASAEGRTDDEAAGTDDPPPALAAAIDRVDDGFYAVDADLEYACANDRARELLALDERAGERDAEAPLFQRAHGRAMALQRPLSVEEYHPATDRWLEARLYPDETGVTVHVRDRTAWRTREQRLEASHRRFRSIFEDAHDAILLGDEREIVAANPAACDLFDSSRSALRGRSLTEFVTDAHDVESAWEEFLAAGRFRGSFSVARPGGDERIVECNAVADVLPGLHLSILRDVTEARERERRLERQRERLAALDHVHDVVRDLNDAIVTGSTRADLERVTCESLARSDSYEFAFVAAVDPSEGTVFERVEAGVDGYLDSIPLSIDRDDAAGRGPLGRAVRTQELQVSNDVFADPDFEPWRADARERGYRAAAAVPITHDGALYGVLGVTSARTGAFTDEERTVIGQLGEILGHAIAARARKRVLLGASVIELELVIDDVVDLFDGPEMDDRSIWFDRVVRVEDDLYLEYGSTPADDWPIVERLVEAVPHWDDVTKLDESGGDVRFELTITSPPMFSVIDAHGGYVESAALHDGTYITTLHFPQETDVRAVTEAISDVYPSVRTIARRQITPSNASLDRLQSALARELTDRQRTALETAYYAGYFEWPRNSSGEEIADTLDVSPATFHEHLRSAQRKLVRAIVETPDAAPSGAEADD